MKSKVQAETEARTGGTRPLRGGAHRGDTSTEETQG